MPACRPARKLSDQIVARCGPAIRAGATIAGAAVGKPDGRLALPAISLPALAGGAMLFGTVRHMRPLAAARTNLPVLQAGSVSHRMVRKS